MNELQNIFREYFDDEKIILEIDTTSNDIEGWDSMSHVLLIATIENKLNIRFTDKEVLLFKNVGDLKSSIEHKFSI